MAVSSRERSSVTDPQRVRMDGSKESGSAMPKPKGGGRAGSSYEKYKQELHAFFDGKRELPENLKEMLSTRPGAQDHGFTPSEEEPPVVEKPKKKRRSKKNKAAQKPEGRRRITARTDRKNTLVAVLKKASSPSAIEQAINQLTEAGYTIPHEEDLLSKALSHPSDDVLCQALTSLLELSEEETLKGDSLLKTRLQNVRLVTSSREVERLCEALQEQLI